MVSCAACGKLISAQGSASGIRERDQVYHIHCAPDDLLGDAATEWGAILDRGMKYFVKKYSIRKKPGDRFAHVGRFSDMGRGITAELKKRQK